MADTHSGSWSSRSLASSFAHSIFYYAIRLGGRWIAYFMLVFVVGFYTLRPDVRRRSEQYRLRRFGRRSGIRSLADCFRLQLEFGMMLVDRAVMGILGDFIMEASDKDRRKLAKLAGQGRGLILVTGHVGCWQLGMSVLDHIDAAKAVVMYKNEGDVDKHYYEHGVRGPSFAVIDPRGPMGGTLEMMDVLKKGGVLCVMGDRNFGSPKNVVTVQLLGGDVEVPMAAYKLASTLEVPMAVTFSHRSGPGRGRIWISRVINVPGQLGRTPDAYRPYAQEFADGLEKFIRMHPWQFYNFYDMWTKE